MTNMLGGGGERGERKYGRDSRIEGKWGKRERKVFGKETTRSFGGVRTRGGGRVDRGGQLN